MAHIFLAIIKDNDTPENIAYLKHWCSKTIDSAARFMKRQQKKKNSVVSEHQSRDE